MKSPPVFEIILELGIFYLEKMKDGQGLKTPVAQMSSKKGSSKSKGDLPSRYEEFTQGNLEDAVQKLIKLFANLATEEETAMTEFQRLKQPLGQFVVELSSAITKCNIDQNEEFILNAVSCITNILYYDTAQSPLFEPETRTAVFTAAKNYLLETKNDEI